MDSQANPSSMAGYWVIPAGQPFTLTSSTVTTVIEKCLAGGFTGVLAEEQHLPEKFFRLESLEAGEILQKLRNYGIRLAVRVSPERLGRSIRFREMVSEENRGRDFALFTEKQKAEEWLLHASGRQGGSRTAATDTTASRT